MRREHEPATARDHQSAERLKFIDEELYWTGEIRRRSIEAAFGVSEQTAKADLRAYREGYAPDLRRDRRDNVYRVPIDFTPRVCKPDAEAYLRRLVERAEPSVPIAVVPDVDRRAIDPTVLQSVIRAVRERREIEIYYRSPRAAAATAYRIAPQALLHDGFRWSVRCYIRRETDGHWGEMVLDRIEEVAAETWPATAPGDRDQDWHSLVELELLPNPELDEAGRSSIEDQYGMAGGGKIVAVRRCMLAYFLKRYQLEEPTTLKTPLQAPLVLRDRAMAVELMPPGMRVPLDGADSAAPRLMQSLRRILPELTEQQILVRALEKLLAGVGP